MVQPLWKVAWQFLEKLNIELLHDPAISFLAIYPRELKTCLQSKTYTGTFIATLFVTVQVWK